MTRIRSGVPLLLCAVVGACGGSRQDEGAREGAAPTAPTEEQLEKGIGPISALELEDDIDGALAARGSEVFTLKCSACHQLEARYVGPPLGDVLERRTPEYVMNMMLNPAEMVERHPVARQLLTEYYTPMPMQDLTREDARAVLEYLRREHGTDEETRHRGGSS